MAKQVFLKLLSKESIGGIEVDSAGINAWEGDPATEGAIDALQEKGYETEGHRAKKLNQELINQADFVLCMTEVQKRNVCSIFTGSKDKIYLLSEFVYMDTDEKLADKDIFDPYGLPPEIYKNCLKEIEGNLKRVLEKVMRKEK